MGDLCLLAASLLHQQQLTDEPLRQRAQVAQIEASSAISQGDRRCNPQSGIAEPLRPEFSPTAALRELSQPDPIATSTTLEPVVKPAKRQLEPTQSTLEPAQILTEQIQTVSAPVSATQNFQSVGAHAHTPPVPSSALSAVSVDTPPPVLNSLPEQPLPTTPRPASNGQLFRQRVAALQAGQTHTRLPTDSFRAAWQGVAEQPTYEQWIGLLNLEARAMSRGQGSNRLTVMLGDSISQWFPSDYYSRDRFWLNQGISGDTTGGILQRLSALDPTRPDRVHIMAGINDLRRGITDPVIVGNLRQIVTRLQARHPQTQIVLHSILPTQLAEISAERIQRLNRQLEAIATQSGIQYLELTRYFADENQYLQSTLTTDGLHLSPRGYQVWEWAMRSHDATFSTLTARYRTYD
jgi:lysophospholipase L1-like esterase